MSLQQRERKVRLQKNNVKGRKTHQGRPKKNLEGNQTKIPAKTKSQEKLTIQTKKLRAEARRNNTRKRRGKKDTANSTQRRKSKNVKTQKGP